jgi:hypothetical protein
MRHEYSKQHTTNYEQYAAGSRQLAACSRQQAVGRRQHAAGSSKQAAGSMQEEKVKRPYVDEFQAKLGFSKRQRSLDVKALAGNMVL